MGLLLLLFSTMTTFNFSTIETPYDPSEYLIVGDSMYLATPLGDTLVGEVKTAYALFLGMFFIGDWDSTDVYYQFSPTENDFDCLDQWHLLKHFGVTAQPQWEANVIIEGKAFAPHMKIMIVPRINRSKMLKIRLCESMKK